MSCSYDRLQIIQYFSITHAIFCMSYNEYRPEEYGNESAHWLKRIIKADKNVSKVLFLQRQISKSESP